MKAYFYYYIIKYFFYKKNRVIKFIGVCDPSYKFGGLSHEFLVDSICHRFNIKKKDIILNFFLKPNRTVFGSIKSDRSLQNKK
jgi:hypothetical protein